MQRIVSGENPFKVLKDRVAIGPSSSGYSLMYGVDNTNFTTYPDAIPANETLVVNGLQQYMWLKLSGNTDNVVVIL